MPTVTPLVSTATVKSYLEVRAGFSDQDAMIDAIVEASTRAIEAACNRHFSTQTFTEYFNSRDTATSSRDIFGQSPSGVVSNIAPQVLYLKGCPLDTDENITVKYSTARTYTAASVVDSDYYAVDGDAGTITLIYGMVPAVRSIQVEYTAGYAIADGTLEDAIPTDLKMAAILQSLWTWNRSRADAIGVDTNRGVRNGPSTFVTPGGIAPEAAPLLAPYRRLRMGNG